MYRENNEQGRSMIEMLGVLSIVGVLSVAGIAGYSKAMSKYKANQIVDQFAHIQRNLQELYTKNQTYKGLTSGDATETAIELGVFPDKMVRTEGSAQVVRHAGGGTVTVSFENNNATIVFNDLQKDAAMALATADFPSNWVRVGNSGN